MRIRNVHERAFAAPGKTVGSLIDRLASDYDDLWPSRWWPPLRLDRPLGPGARGGMGPSATPSRSTCPARRGIHVHRAAGLGGEHRFELIDAGSDRPGLRHTLDGRAAGLMRLRWPLVFRPLHDALLEDALHGAERSMRAERPEPMAWSPYVRYCGRCLRCLGAPELASRTARARRLRARDQDTDRVTFRLSARPRLSVQRGGSRPCPGDR